jgi:hypothetical protein
MTIYSTPSSISSSPPQQKNIQNMEPKCFAIGDGSILIRYDNKREMSPPIDGTMPIPQSDGTWIYPKPSEKAWEEKRQREAQMKGLTTGTPLTATTVPPPKAVNNDMICPVCHQNTRRFLVWPGIWLCMDNECEYNKRTKK